MPATTRPQHRTYVLDTSVLLSDPHALLRFDEHEVVVPVVVIIELEAKRARIDETLAELRVINASCKRQRQERSRTARSR